MPCPLADPVLFTPSCLRTCIPAYRRHVHATTSVFCRWYALSTIQSLRLKTDSISLGSVLLVRTDAQLTRLSWLCSTFTHIDDYHEISDRPTYISRALSAARRRCAHCSGTWCLLLNSKGRSSVHSRDSFQQFSPPVTGRRISIGAVFVRISHCLLVCLQLI